LAPSWFKLFKRKIDLGRMILHLFRDEIAAALRASQ
jgi:hypothetical protein